MLTIPLARLEREGTLEIQAEIPPDDPNWEGLEFRYSAPLRISGKARLTTSGEVLVTLNFLGQKAQECRRCLEPVTVPVKEKLSLLFVPSRETGDEDDEVRVLPERGSELDLGEAIREELILLHWPYALCREDCRGLCPQCGENRNLNSCQCSTDEPDPRWDTLRGLKEE